MSQAILSFKPKHIVKHLLGSISQRARDIIEKRYGLSEANKMTLESIGEIYGITRERVRQIESYSLVSIRKSDAFQKYEGTFSELRDVMRDYGGVVNEHDFLKYLSNDSNMQNHLHFLLVLGDYFERMREDESLHHRWTVDKELSNKVTKSIFALTRELNEDELVKEADIVIRFLEHLKQEIKGIRDRDLAMRWLSLSKNIGRNPLGEWGLSNAPNIKAKGIRDLAYLVLRQHGSPMHFTEVSNAIERRFGRPAHTATCHNELIKDKRFVLVGRGLYALTEWGYEQGVVREVIKSIMEKDGPLTKSEIIEKVLKERLVKENTILVNLQNSKHFKKDKKGRYSSVK